MVERLAERVAVVTGAGSGIGRATTLQLLREGANVVAVDRNGEDVEETTRQGNGPGRAVALQCDVTSEDAPSRILERSSEVCGPPDILVNNAGVGDARPAHLTEDDNFDGFIDVNVRALFRLSRESVKAMRAANRGGCIVNIASIFGITGFRGSSAYSAAKSAVIGLTRNMAADYGLDGIRVNAVAPGIIATPLTAERLATNPWFVDALVGGTPLRRPGRAEEIAAAVAFLCSADASYISGHTLVVDGGYSATHFRPRPDDPT